MDGDDIPYSSFDFNPRSREGSDPVSCHRGLIGRISIHAPVKGATAIIAAKVSILRISIHAPVKGATTKLGCWRWMS